MHGRMEVEASTSGQKTASLKNIAPTSLIQQGVMPISMRYLLLNCANLKTSICLPQHRLGKNGNVNLACQAVPVRHPDRDPDLEAGAICNTDSHLSQKAGQALLRSTSEEG